MKKTVLFLLSTFLLISSCQNVSSKNNKKNDNTKKEVVNKKEDGVVSHLTKAQFLELVMNYEKNPKEWVFLGDKPCVIDFYADWCRPCKIAAPILEELAKEYKGKINFYKIDTQQEQELAAVFGIRSIPAFLFCPKKGQPQMSNGIGRTTEETKTMFKKRIDEVLLK